MGREIEVEEEVISGESEDASAEMENCVCEGKYERSIEKIREKGGGERKGNIIDDRREFQCKNREGGRWDSVRGIDG